MDAMAIIGFFHIAHKLYEVYLRVLSPSHATVLRTEQTVVKGTGNDRNIELLFNCQNTNRISDK